MTSNDPQGNRHGSVARSVSEWVMDTRKGIHTGGILTCTCVEEFEKRPRRPLGKQVNSPGFEVVFEIGRRSFPWTMFLSPAPFLVFGLLAMRYAPGKRPIFRVTGAAFASFAALFLLIGAIVFVPEFFSLWRDYKNGNSTVVEGIINNFHPAPNIGPTRESFSVNQTSFSYNVLDASPCFHNAPFPHPVGNDGEGLLPRFLYSANRDSSLI